MRTEKGQKMYFLLMDNCDQLILNCGFKCLCMSQNAWGAIAGLEIMCHYRYTRRLSTNVCNYIRNDVAISLIGILSKCMYALLAPHCRRQASSKLPPTAV